jgi:hypothetical protein
MLKQLIYHNSLSCRENIEDFILEGHANISFENNKMCMKNAIQAEEGQKANFVLWCPVDFPSDIQIEWEFYPVKEPGLCILFFAAKGRHNEDIFDEKLQKRNGEYDLYHHGDIDAFHVSYFRRKWAEERAFHTCNLRKSYGFHLVCQGGDPIPSVEDAVSPYHMKLIKYRGNISFFINDLNIFSWKDEGVGQPLQGGKIGFRQMAPLVAEYAELKVYSIKEEPEND